MSDGRGGRPRAGQARKIGRNAAFFSSSAPKTLSSFVAQSMQSLLKLGDMQRFFALWGIRGTPREL